MQIPDVFTCAMAVLSAMAATWAACRLFYGRQLKAALRRVDKLNHARQLYDRHGAQVRRQIDHLKRELDLQRAQQPWAPLSAPPPAPPRSASRRDWQDTDADRGTASLPPDGFAPTLPLDGFAPTLPLDGFAATRPMPRPGHAGAAAAGGDTTADGFAATRPFDGFAATRPMLRQQPSSAARAHDLGRRGQVG